MSANTENAVTLDQLPLGESATVVKLNCQGVTRRRLMDLGLLPGVRVYADLRSPLGDPVAYRIRDAAIALRRDQARQVEITLKTKEAPYVG
jgi:Fe2+ transport system protein FeoA